MPPTTTKFLPRLSKGLTLPLSGRRVYFLQSAEEQEEREARTGRRSHAELVPFLVAARHKQALYDEYSREPLGDPEL